MTDPTESGIEPLELPFARRSVRWTLAILATAAQIGMIVSWWTTPVSKEDDAYAGVTIDINHASVREFAILPGVGPVLAKRIVENRDRQGPFLSVEDLARVRGMGPKKLQLIQTNCIANPLRGER